MTQAGEFNRLAKAARLALGRGGELRGRLANIAHLLTGSLFGSLLGLAAVALCARSLGLDAYGKLALMLAFVKVVERIVSFQSWQPLIRYGAGLSEPEHRESLRALLKFGLLLDIGAAFCGWAIAVAAAQVVAPLIGIPDHETRLLVLLSTVLLFQISGTPTAVQRLAGNFRLLAYGQLANSALRALLCLLGLLIEADLAFFVVVWAGTQILGSLVTMLLATMVLRRQGVRGVLSAPLKGIRRRFPGLWSFTWGSNLSLTLWISSQQFDTLLVGALTGPASAGLYNIAKRIGQAGQQLGVQAQVVLYPDVARLWTAGRLGDFKRAVTHIETFLLCAGALGVIALFMTIHPLIAWTAGPEFSGAATLALVQAVAVVLLLCGSAARVALLAMGRQREVLCVVAAATAAFYATALVLVPQIGAIGGNFAHVALGVVWAAGLVVTLRRSLKASAAATTDNASSQPLGVTSANLASNKV